MMTETSNLDRAFSSVCSNFVISRLNLFQIKRFNILSRKKGICSSIYRRDKVNQALPLVRVRQLISLRHVVVVVSLLVNKLEYDEGSRRSRSSKIASKSHLVPPNRSN